MRTRALEGELGYKGEKGYSAYEIAVLNGYEGTEEEWINHFGLDLSGYLQNEDVIDDLTHEYTTRPLSANQGKVLMTGINQAGAFLQNQINDIDDDKTVKKYVVTDTDSNGTMQITFRKQFNVVSIFVEATLNEGKTSMNMNKLLNDIPDWLKISTEDENLQRIYVDAKLFGVISQNNTYLGAGAMTFNFFKWGTSQQYANQYSLVITYSNQTRNKDYLYGAYIMD